jgi:hypothetical protein
MKPIHLILRLSFCVLCSSVKLLMKLSTLGVIQANCIHRRDNLIPGMAS